MRSLLFFLIWTFVVPGISQILTPTDLDSSLNVIEQEPIEASKVPTGLIPSSRGYSLGVDFNTLQSTHLALTGSLPLSSQPDSKWSARAAVSENLLRLDIPWTQRWFFASDLSLLATLGPSFVTRPTQLFAGFIDPQQLGVMGTAGMEFEMENSFFQFEVGPRISSKESSIHLLLTYFFMDRR